MTFARRCRGAEKENARAEQKKWGGGGVPHIGPSKGDLSLMLDRYRARARNIACLNRCATRFSLAKRDGTEHQFMGSASPSKSAQLPKGARVSLREGRREGESFLSLSPCLSLFIHARLVKEIDCLSKGCFLLSMLL